MPPLFCTHIIGSAGRNHPHDDLLIQMMETPSRAFSSLRFPKLHDISRGCCVFDLATCDAIQQHLRQPQDKTAVDSAEILRSQL